MILFTEFLRSDCVLRPIFEDFANIPDFPVPLCSHGHRFARELFRQAAAGDAGAVSAAARRRRLPRLHRALLHDGRPLPYVGCSGARVCAALSHAVGSSCGAFCWTGGSYSMAWSFRLFPDETPRRPVHTLQSISRGCAILA
eukprot:6188734-Pleurochrysis_carterae.AAC.2